jgi:II/X family phage/plasmid replication protein
MIDTIKIESPSIDEKLALRLENLSILRQGIDNSSGEVLYELTTGTLEGSHDARISFRVWRQRPVQRLVQTEPGVFKKKGSPKMENSRPYLIIEASVHKIKLGHNVYGGPVDFQATVKEFLAQVERRLGVTLPAHTEWIVRRVDWAEVFRLPFVAIQEFFESCNTVDYPRRKGHKYGVNALYFPGSFTTIKLYHKGVEFREHDYDRIKRHLLITLDRQGCGFQKSQQLVAKKMLALQRLANNRLRCEVEIHAEKLRHDFGALPLVHQVTDDYLAGVYEHDMRRLLKEGKSGMDTVRDNRAVMKRLRLMHGETNAERYFGFWSRLTMHGENIVKQEFLPARKATFYRYKKALLDAGVSWVGTDIHVIANDTPLPKDFSPLRADMRRCYLPARNRATYMPALQSA